LEREDCCFASLSVPLSEFSYSIKFNVTDEPLHVQLRLMNIATTAPACLHLYCGFRECERVVQSNVVPLPAPRAVKLLDRMRERIRLMHYSRRTEESYVYWCRALVHRHPQRLTLTCPIASGEARTR
jgi:hypothetical protein